MFTGIIAGTGTVLEIAPADLPGVTRLVIDAGDLTADLPEGGSLAVSGVCLTSVDATDPRLFTTELMGETMERTCLGALEPGSRVNLERCVPADGRLDGHVVQGHVDATGTVVAAEDEGGWRRLRVSFPAHLAGQIATKGAIAVDGVSLTVTATSAPGAEPWFEVGLIPATLETTTLGEAGVGRVVNLETDVLAKYVARLLAVGRAGQAEGADS